MNELQRHLLSRSVLAILLVIAPIGTICFLTLNVLLPTLKNPESKIYSSSIGYPSLKRLVGQPIKVEAVPVTVRNVSNSVAAPGEAVPLREVNVHPLISGTVEKIYVAEGDKVRQGQPLLQIQQSPFQDAVNRARNDVTNAATNLKFLPKLQQQNLIELQAKVDSAKQNLDVAQAKLERLRSVSASGGIALIELADVQNDCITRRQELISARQALARAEIEQEREAETSRLALSNSILMLRQAQRNLSQTILRASTDGLVSQVNINSGEVANKQFAAITLTQNVVFKAYIDQARLNDVKVGSRATVRLVAYPGGVFQGKVMQLNPTIQTDTVKPGKVGTDRQYTYSAWIALDNLQMPPGLQGYAQFEQGKQRLVIPENAVTHLSAGEGMVMVAEGSQATVKKIKLGRAFGNQREAIAGLRVGEKVIPDARALKPGDRLKVEVSQAL